MGFSDRFSGVPEGFQEVTLLNLPCPSCYKEHHEHLYNNETGIIQVGCDCDGSHDIYIGPGRADPK